jgi:poly-gamma-glutamate synthesis protein (capsule biosynthesis protein)
MTRDAKLIALFLTIAAGCISAVAGHLVQAKGPPPQTQTATVRAASPDSVSVEFLGDTMLADGAQPMLNRRGYDRPFRRGVKAALDADYVVANLEGPVTYHSRPLNPGKDYSYAIDPTAVGALKRAGVDALNLGNNHSMDSGRPGLIDTMTYLHEAGLPSFGAGLNLARAEQPLLIRSQAGTVGIVSLGENFGSSIRAEDKQAGTVVLSPETVQRGIAQARAAGADWVVAFVHWGDNYMRVNAQQKYWGRLLTDAGYDLIVGAGPHISQPIIFRGRVPIAYSVGNFVFGAPGRFDSFGVPGIGLILTAQFSKATGVSLYARCLITDNDVVKYRPRLCRIPRSTRVLSTLATNVVMDGKGGYVRPPSRAGVPVP